MHGVQAASPLSRDTTQPALLLTRVSLDNRDGVLEVAAELSYVADVGHSDADVHATLQEDARRRGSHSLSRPLSLSLYSARGERSKADVGANTLALLTWAMALRSQPCNFITSITE